MKIIMSLKTALTSKQAERYVSGLYRGIFGRDAAMEEQQHHIDRLSTGQVSWLELFEEFLANHEFTNRKDANFYVPLGHYYSPVPDPAQVAFHMDRLRKKTLPETLPGIAIDRASMIYLWEKFLPFFSSIPFSAEKQPGYRYCFVNPSYSWGDGSLLHAMLRLYQPKRLVEIGCGWSSACILDTVETFFDRKCELTFIEPYPQLLQSLLEARERKHKSSKTPYRIINKAVQQVDGKVFSQLEDGDFLFIDSTHVLSTGSDVCHELLEILPRLRPGVMVHFHDVFWPFDYPERWAVEENRCWNEIYALRAFLCNNDAWRVHFFGHYFATFEKQRVKATYPNYLRNPGGALWLRRV